MRNGLSGLDAAGVAPPIKNPEVEMEGGGIAGLLPADGNGATTAGLPSPARTPGNGAGSGMVVGAALEGRKKSAANDLPSPA